MKKGVFALIFAFIMMAKLVSNVAAAPAQSNRSAILKSVKYERGGVVLFFETSGLAKKDLKNLSFTAHSGHWNMVCNFVNDTTNVRCLVSKKLSVFAGEDFHGVFAGFFFAGKLPSARAFSNPMATDVSGTCADGQTLWYTFEYSHTSYQAEVWSEYYMDPDTFYSIYNLYPEYTSQYTDSDLSNGNSSTNTYYIYGYTTTTGGYGSTPSENWAILVSAYEADGFTVQKTGESCDYNL